MNQPRNTGKTEKIMNKTTTHKDSLNVCADLPLEDHELDSVSGGGPAGGDKKACDAIKAFEQLLQEIS